VGARTPLTDSNRKKWKCHLSHAITMGYRDTEGRQPDSSDNLIAISSEDAPNRARPCRGSCWLSILWRNEGLVFRSSAHPARDLDFHHRRKWDGCSQIPHRSPACGTKNLSPALQRWVGVVRNLSPVGTPQILLAACCLLRVLPCLRHSDFLRRRLPSAEALAKIFRAYGARALSFAPRISPPPPESNKS
jgi:hypothetical protein